MNKIVLITNLAKEDISNIAEYIAKDNKTASISIVENFYKTFELLSNFPETAYRSGFNPTKTYCIIRV